MDTKQICGVIFAVAMVALAARADSLELKNGSLINGKFMGGSKTSISFQVGSSVQNYDVVDIRSLQFGPDSQGVPPSNPSRQPSTPAMGEEEVAKASPSVTIPAGTRISIRTMDRSSFPQVAGRKDAPSREMHPPTRARFLARRAGAPAGRAQQVPLYARFHC